MIHKPHICKDAYIGAPVRAHAHVCEYCHGHGCDHCGHHEHHHGCECTPKGVCEVVVDDANELIYIYGNIKHEDFHAPARGKVPYVAVPGGLRMSSFAQANELFEGEQDSNNVILAHKPTVDEMFVFLNGVKQVEGAERDYIVKDEKTIHFNFYALLPNDRVEVVYKYKVGD